MKTKITGLVVGTLFGGGAAAAPLDYNHIEVGTALTLDDSRDEYGIGAEVNKRFGKYLFAEADLSYGLIEPDQGDSLDKLSFGVGGGTIITFPGQAELALSVQFDWTSIDSGTTETTRQLEAELDLPLEQNMTLEVNVYRTLQEGRDGYVYVGIEGGEKGGLRWEGGLTRTFDVDSDVDAVHGVRGRVVVPLDSMNLYIGGSTDIDNDDSDAINLNAGIRIDL